MSKTTDATRVSGSHEADRTDAGVSDLAGNGGSGPVDGELDGPATGPVVRRSRRAAEAPVDAVPEPDHERQSQARARDREALRAYRALAESQAVRIDDGARVETPTRRQLRLQQVQGRAIAPGTLSEASVDGSSRDPLPGGRRDRRHRTTPTPTVVDPSSGGPGRADPNAGDLRGAVDVTSIEEAVAARQLLVDDALKLAVRMQSEGNDDPFVVDPDVLAQQKALAERAAILNSRARRMQELSEQNQQRIPATNDPAAAHNLSIIAPPEFIRVPGGAQAVLRAPTTSHIPVVIPRPRQVVAETKTPSDQSGNGSDLLVQAQPSAEAAPIGASSAFGLEPLDAMTAGLGRMRRLRYIQYSLVGVGAAALLTGIIMTVSSLNG
jgi:hypothetical protein